MVQTKKLFPSLIVEFNLLNRSDGSSIYCEDKNVLLVSVNGPIDISSSKENNEKATLKCIFKKRISTNKDDVDIKALENFICSSLESAICVHLYPRTLINITIQELQSKNFFISSSINASVLALMDAGISLKYLISSVTICVKKNKELVILNSEDNLNQYESYLIFVIENKKNKIISIFNEGVFPTHLFKNASNLAVLACNEIFKFYKESVKKRFNPSLNK